jgi:hypothetical protein
LRAAAANLIVVARTTQSKPVRGVICCAIQIGRYDDRKRKTGEGDMKKVLFAFGFLLVATAAQAQTTTFYGPAGQYQGQATRSGNTTSFYGPAGQYQGQATQSGNTTTYYGPAGQYQGQTTTMPSLNSGFGLRRY